MIDEDAAFSVEGEGLDCIDELWRKTLFFTAGRKGRSPVYAEVYELESFERSKVEWLKVR